MKGTEPYKLEKKKAKFTLKEKRLRKKEKKMRQIAPEGGVSHEDFTI